MKSPLIFLGLILISTGPASSNALQTPEELRQEGILKKRQQRARENMEQRMNAKDAIQREKQEEREKQEQEALERDVREEQWGEDGPRYVP